MSTAHPDIHLEGLDVLLVDDDTDMLFLLSRALARHGARVETASDGIAALKKFEQQNFPIVVTDINMPGMSGLELLRHIKKIYHKPPPVVMMITAYGDAENFNTARELGADDFLTKPVDFKVLKEKFKL